MSEGPTPRDWIYVYVRSSSKFYPSGSSQMHPTEKPEFPEGNEYIQRSDGKHILSSEDDTLHSCAIKTARCVTAQARQ